MPDADRLAIAAHLHVLLRRKTGRVTDTEWMAANADYALEIARFSRERAREEGGAELLEWADRLERATREGMAQPPVPRPLAESAAQLLRARPESPAPDAPRYVGGIR
ncbi:MAG: hypothetical protein F9K35_16795 [Burkholderiaceae bacterium]|nr:MAG: hypothetical protein F9K35_16795 [Burkholderiaceae bacterium]